MGRRNGMVRALGLVAGCAAIAGATWAQTAASEDPIIRVSPAVGRTVTVDDAVRRDCTARPLAGRRGVWSERFTAPATGSVGFRLRGTSSRRNDWDLALFDAVSGERVSTSAGFGASETAQAVVKPGAQVLVQVCRRTGPKRSMRLDQQFAELAPRLLDIPTGIPSLVRVPIGSREDIERLERLGFDVTHDIRKGSAGVVLYGAADRQRLVQAGFSAVTEVADLLTQFRADRRATARAAAAGASALPTGRTDYRAYEDYARELKAFVENHKGLVRGGTLDFKTFQGRDLQWIEIAADVDRKDDGRPVFLLNGMHHAREWPSPEGIMEFAHDLINGYGKDDRITKLLRDVRVVVMPLTNADGYIVSRTAPNPDPDEENVGAVYSTATGIVVFGGSLGYKRKNCNPVGVTTAVPSLLPCEIAMGVDPNRNYGESWGGPGASSNPNDQSYRGSGPFSEPETQAFRSLFSKLNATMMLTIHNVAALVLRPPGLKADGFAPDEAALKELGDRMGKVTGYTSQYGWQLYDTTGTTDDWTYAVSGGFGYTIEMGPPGGVFHGNYQTSVIDQYQGKGRTAGKGLREAYLMAAEAARNPAYTARVSGRAPAGRTLRITKEFVTKSYPVCAVAGVVPINAPEGLPVDTACEGEGEIIELPEKFEFSTVVPASGNFEWWVNPSTRPFVGKAGQKESYRLACEQDGKVLQSAEVFVARGEAAVLELPCGGVLPPVAGAFRVLLGTKLGRAAIANARRRLAVNVKVAGGDLRRLRLSLLRGSKVVASGRLSSVTPAAKKRVTLKLRKGVRLRAGSYRLRLTAERVKGSTVRVTRTVRVS